MDSGKESGSGDIATPQFLRRPHYCSIVVGQGSSDIECPAMWTPILFAALLLQSITSDQIKDGLKDPSQWLTYSGDYSGQRHSPLKSITPANAGQLRAAWTFQTSVLGKWEASPLVIDGVIYTSGQDNNAWAIDGKTGRMIWRYRRELPATGMNVCCGNVNRGLAVYKDKLLMVTLDAHLVALDIKSGKPVYDVVIDDYKKGYTGTAAPLVVKDKVIV